jgi:hypothetical protein
MRSSTMLTAKQEVSLHTQFRLKNVVTHMGDNIRTKILIVQIVCGNLKRIKMHCILGYDAA